MTIVLLGDGDRMHMKYLESEHPGLYEQLILYETLQRHLADANERADAMMAQLMEQMAKQAYHGTPES